MNGTNDAERVRVLEEEVRTLRAQIEREDGKLKSEALRSGSRGVAGGLLLMLLIVVACGLFQMADVKLLSGNQLVMIGGILAAALLIYFGFILNFALKIKATATGVKVSSERAGKQ